MHVLMLLAALTASGTRDSVPLRTYTQEAILYQQRSGEYRALCYQAFHAAELDLLQDLATPDFSGLPPAVISDLDETVLDNSPYQAQLALDNRPYSPLTWNAWMRMERAGAVPGAVDFMNFADTHGITIFYITNRDSASAEETMNVMRGLGFPQVSPGHFLFRTGNSNKQARFDSVRKRYRVLLQLGDNLNDFSGAFYHRTYADRMRLADSLKDHFGIDYIVLPNPMYGDWEEALYDYRAGLPEEQADSVRRGLLKGYRN